MNIIDHNIVLESSTHIEEYDNDGINLNINNEEFLENISYDDECKRLNIVKYSNLEWETIMNNYDGVYKALLDGETIFYSENGVCKKICNGSYQRYKNHPKKCKNVCYRTALYLSLKNNCRIYRTIYKLLKELYQAKPSIRRPCLCCHDDDDDINSDTNDFQKNIISLMEDFFHSKCVCEQKKIFCKWYQDTHLNLKHVNNFLSKKLPLVEKYLLNIISVNDNTLDLKNTTLYLEPLEGCIHENMSVHRLVYCKKKNQEEDKEKIENIVYQLLKLDNWYQENIKINKLLLNQQFYELYQYSLHTISDEKNLLLALKTFIKKDDPYIDINYTNPFCGHTVLSLTVFKDDYPLLVKYMIKNDAKTDIEYNLSLFALYKKHYSSALQLLKIEKPDRLKDMIDRKTAYQNILKDKYLEREIKDELLEILIRNGVNINKVTTGDEVVVLVLKSDEKNLLDFIIKNIDKYKLEKIKITGYHISLAIKLNKLDELHLLLENSEKGIINKYNKDNIDDLPIFTYLKCVDKYNHKLNMLNALIKFDADLNIKNKKENTPLHIATKRSYNSIVNVLLKQQCDPFIKNNKGETALIVGIKNANFTIVKKFINLKNAQPIVNIVDKNGLPPFFWALHCSKPYKMLELLIECKYLDFDLCNSEGKTVLMYLLKCDNINNDEKIKILNKLMKKCDVLAYNKLQNKPLIVQAIEKDQYKLVKQIFKFLIEEKIILLYNEDEKLEKYDSDVIFYNDGNGDTINILSDEPLNYYPIVHQYLVNIKNKTRDKNIFYKNDNDNNDNDNGDIFYIKKSDNIENYENGFEELTNSALSNFDTNIYTLEKIIISTLVLVVLYFYISKSQIYRDQDQSLSSDSDIEFDNLSDEVDKLLNSIENNTSTFQHSLF